ncbi:MAG: inositol polyphosphate kinase family protein [Cytophagales bacterium]|nr:inositol polyphosphate kinase family protein [Cytophagales bacterium]
MARQKIIQMAGHWDDILFLPGRVVKRIEKLEAEQYLEFREYINHAAPDTPLPQIPKFEGPYNSLQELAAKVSDEDRQKITQKWKKQDPKYKYIILENATEEHPSSKIRDLKIGTSTVSEEEQRIGQKKGSVETLIKAAKHTTMDMPVSKKYGFRDEDSQKRGARSAKKNLVIFRQMIAEMGPEVAKKIRSDVRKIYNWISSSQTVYVGASMLMVANEDKPEISKAVMIDFAHPISTRLGFDESKVEKYRTGMLTGFSSILSMLNIHINENFEIPYPNLEPEKQETLKTTRVQISTETQSTPPTPKGEAPSPSSSAASEFPILPLKQSPTAKTVTEYSFYTESEFDRLNDEESTSKLLSLTPQQSPTAAAPQQTEMFSEQLPPSPIEMTVRFQPSLESLISLSPASTPDIKHDFSLVHDSIRRISLPRINRIPHFSTEFFDSLIKREEHHKGSSRRPSALDTAASAIPPLPLRDHPSLQTIRNSLEQYETLEWHEEPITLHSSFKVLIKLENEINSWLYKHPYTLLWSTTPESRLTIVLLKLLNAVQKEMDELISQLVRLKIDFPVFDEQDQERIQKCWQAIRQNWDSLFPVEIDPNIKNRIFNYFAHLMAYNSGLELLEEIFLQEHPYDIKILSQVKRVKEGKEILNQNFLLDISEPEEESFLELSFDDANVIPQKGKVRIRVPDMEHMNDTSLMVNGLHEIVFEKTLLTDELGEEWSMLSKPTSPDRNYEIELVPTPAFIQSPAYLRFARALAHAQDLMTGKPHDLLSKLPSKKKRSKQAIKQHFEDYKDQLTEAIENPLRLEAFLPLRTGTSMYSAYSQGGWYEGLKSSYPELDDDEFIRTGYMPS